MDQSIKKISADSWSIFCPAIGVYWVDLDCVVGGHGGVEVRLVEEAAVGPLPHVDHHVVRLLLTPTNACIQ